MQNSKPFVIKNAINQWPASKWTPDTLSEIVGSKRLRFRLGPKQHTVGKLTFENDCQYCHATINEFLNWMKKSDDEAEKEANLQKADADNPFHGFNPKTHFAYLDYKYMFEVFDECEEHLSDVTWDIFGLEKDGLDTTLWMGTKGAFTPCHYDTYGFNLVAQIFGRKRWTLFPPEESKFMKPLRLPYEESSVFAGVDLLSPWEPRTAKLLSKTTPTVVVLEPGDLLYVPNKWWHFVQCLDDGCISLNSWVDLEIDENARLSEAITRCTVGLVKVACREELLDNEVDFQDSLILLNKLLSDDSEKNDNFESSLNEPLVKKYKPSTCTGDQFLTKFLKDTEKEAAPVPILSFDKFCSLMKSETDFMEEDYIKINKTNENISQGLVIDKNTFINTLLHPTMIDHLKNLLLNNS